MVNKFDFQDYIQSRLEVNSVDDEKHMRVALQAAERAKSKGDVAVAAALIWHNATLVEHDTKYSEQDVTNYAEMNLLRKASMIMVRKMDEAVLYSTLEPTAMCALAAHTNGVKEIVFGAYDYENGFVSSEKSLDLEKWDIVYKGGILAKECFDILSGDLKLNSGIEKTKEE